MDLTLVEAWALWWSGQQLTDHTLYGAPVLWLARAGKLLAFLAGTTIVLDVIGSERILAWGERLQRNPVLGTLLAFLIIPLAAFVAPPGYLSGDPAAGGLVLIVVFVLLLSGLVLYGPMLFRLLVLGFGRLLAMPRFERWLRIIAVPLFFTGFALDYLAS